jgi:hypothetical protein
VPDFHGGWKEVNEYERQGVSVHDMEMIFPIKLDFHYPLRSNFFLAAEAGVKIKGILNRIYDKNLIKRYSYSLSYLTYPPYTSGDSYEETDIFFSKAYRDISKVRCDLLVGLGFYYKFAHGDLLRFTAGINYAFSPDLIGEYMYLIPLSGGSFFVKNDFFYTQISYIHTLNWQKSKKYLKKQEYSFASRKERRGQIYELLKGW